jgi:TonB family protein
MSYVAVQLGGWPRRRWWLTVLAVFAGQLGLIFLLSERAPIRPRPAAGAPTLRLAGPATAELLALEDPTLFTLPHRRSFAGRAWMLPTWTTNRSFSWSVEPNWLTLNTNELGAAFNQFVATNRFELPQVFAPPEPALTLPALAAEMTAPTASALKITGALAERKLLTPLTLPSWPSAELLTNSVVRMVVDLEGRPVSLALLSGSGSPKADQQALEQARAARFNSIERGQSPGPVAQSLAWGSLIFEWNTLPLPPTSNLPPGAAAPR